MGKHKWLHRDSNNRNVRYLHQKFCYPETTVAIIEVGNKYTYYLWNKMAGPQNHKEKDRNPGVVWPRRHDEENITRWKKLSTIKPFAERSAKNIEWLEAAGIVFMSYLPGDTVTWCSGFEPDPLYEFNPTPPLVVKEMDEFEMVTIQDALGNQYVVTEEALCATKITTKKP